MGNAQRAHEKGGRLIIQTVKSNSWSSAAACLMGSAAHMAFVQEHKLHGMPLLEANERLRKRG